MRKRISVVDIILGVILIVSSIYILAYNAGLITKMELIKWPHIIYQYISSNPTLQLLMGPKYLMLANLLEYFLAISLIICGFGLLRSNNTTRITVIIFSIAQIILSLYYDFVHVQIDLGYILENRIVDIPLFQALIAFIYIIFLIDTKTKGQSKQEEWWRRRDRSGYPHVWLI